MGALVAERYEIVRELGRGAMAQVLLARQVNLGRIVVLKRMLPDGSPRQAAALIGEASIAARLHHPCIVDVFDVHPDADSVVIAMEYVPGVSLREMMARAPAGLPVAVALTIALDVLRALAYAHGVRQGAHIGVVHRDVKPRNIIVTFAGDSKLIDFGISRWLSDDGAWDATSVSGTVGYMAPEQQNARRVDARVDQFAVGITLREMLSGRSPGDLDSPASAAATIGAGSSRGEPDPALDAIIARAVAEQPDDRYDSCAELAAALTELARARTIALSPALVERWLAEHMRDRVLAWEREAELESAGAAPQTKPAPVDTPTEHTQGPSPTSSRQRRVRPWRATVAIGIVIVLALVALWLASSRGSAAGEPRTVRIAASPGAGADASLATATEHLLARAFRDASSRAVWIARVGDTSPAVTITVEVSVDRGIVHLVARRHDQPAVLARAEARSLSEACEQLATVLGGVLAAGRPALGPDAAELAEMRTIGTRSFDQYRRYRIASEEARMSNTPDSQAFAARFAALSREDPSWPRPYVEQYLYTSPFATESGGDALLASARMHADAARDRAAVAAREVLAAIAEGKTDEAVAAGEALFRAHGQDVLVGEAYAAALAGTSRDDELRAVFRRLQAAHPDLYFAAAVASVLEVQERDAEAEQVLRDALASHPENVPVSSRAVTAAMKRGDLATAREIARRMRLVWGGHPTALSDLFEITVSTGDLVEAQRIADEMLLASPGTRGDGRLGAAIIAVLQGRFAAAVGLAHQAITDYRTGGRPFDVVACYQLLLELEPASARASIDAMLAAADRAPSGSAELRYRRALLDRGARCPAFEPFLATLTGADREDARRAMTRAAAAVGCARCEDVVALGFAAIEVDGALLLELGRCAQQTNDLRLARRVFERTVGLTASDAMSPYYAVLARYHLGNVLVALGDRDGARIQYETFLAHWASADRALPEIAAARSALATLRSAPQE